MQSIEDIIIHSLTFGRINGWEPTIENIAIHRNLNVADVREACKQMYASEPEQYWLDDPENPTIIRLIY